MVQWLLGRRTPRAWRRSRRTWSMLRLGVPLLYVGASVQFIGGEALPLLALFVPVVAGAAAIGTFQGWLTASMAAVIFLLPELGNLGSTASVALHGITLAGVALVLAFGTRRIVRALELTAREARRAVAAERRRSRQIRALEEVSHLLASRGPTDAHLATIVGTVASRFGYAHVSVYLGDAASMKLVAQHGYEHPIARFEPSTGVAGRVMRSKQIDFVPDVSSDPEYIDGGLDVTSLICAPLLSDGQLLGLLNVEASGGARLDGNDRTLIGIISGRLATAIALGRDRQALAARADLFRDIDAFASEVSSSLAIDALARVIVEALSLAIPADVLAVTLLERASGRYRIEAARGVGPEVIGREILAGDGLAGRAIRDRALVLDDALSKEKLPPDARDVDTPPLAHGVGMPLVRDGVVLGAMTVGRTAREAPSAAWSSKGCSSSQATPPWPRTPSCTARWRGWPFVTR